MLLHRRSGTFFFYRNGAGKREYRKTPGRRLRRTLRPIEKIIVL
jgi:hypothetical protein